MRERNNCLTAAGLFCAPSLFGFIGGGYDNCIDATRLEGSVYDTIVGGSCNKICANTSYSHIGAGRGNTISANYSFIGGGCNNLITNSATYGNYTSVIVGGLCNLICAGTSSACNNAILGGCCNTVSGYYSTIIGGAGNTVVHNYATASGYNITSAFDCTFHANQIAVPNTQPFSSLGGGLLQYFVPTPALIAAGIPATSCIVLIDF